VRFTFTDEQRRFQESLRAFLAKECTPERIRALWQTETGRAPELWTKLAEMGLLGILVPEAQGGLGMDEVDLVLLFEECGRAALPAPVVETAAVAVPLLAEAAATAPPGAPVAAVADEWLPRVAAGAAVLTVGHPMAPFVADAHVADLLLLAHDDELHVVPRAQVTLIAEPANDPSARLFRVAWTPAAATRIAAGDAARALLAAAVDRAALALGAEQLGVAQQLVDLAARYATQREQFGRPIGSFQAVKHMLANAQVRIEFARPVVYRAAWTVADAGRSRPAPAPAGTGGPTAPGRGAAGAEPPQAHGATGGAGDGTGARAIAVSHAKAAASEAAVQAAKTALQVHGAIGYTWEVDLQIWMKRAWALDVAWGTRLWHRARIGRAILDAEAPAPTFGFGARP
jgi:alkylation response protein AidB-like acyl-CoA dehydrogenase